MTLNFNVKPYYDDFDPNKNFHRILFKPGVAVQARELTQSQTILQDQISKFASSIFSQNTPISGGKVTVNLDCFYIKLFNSYNGVNIVASDFKNKIITDSTGTILARVIATHEGTGTNNSGDPPTLIVTYISGQQFTDYMDIFATDGSNVVARSIGVTNGTTSVGRSSVASITEGVFYVVNGYNTSNIPNDDGTYSKYSIGNFVSVLQQTVILEKYSNTPSLRVGLQITESITEYTEDPSLFDPAIGASNYQAPGADRYTIKLDLITLPLQLGSDDGFIDLLRISNGTVVKQTDGTVYSTIDDYFAKRTYDTNGDFIVSDFNLTPVANTSSNTQYDLRIGKGLAYVRGYRVENQSDTILTNDRARNTSTQNNNSVFVDYGSYFYVTNMRGIFDTTNATQVDLHCKIAPTTANIGWYNSTLVGTGYIRNLSYVSNSTDSNTQSYVYKAYIHDIVTNTLSGNIAATGTTTTTLQTPDSKFLNVADTYNGVVLTIDSGPGAGYRGQVTAYTSGRLFTVSPAFTTVPTASSTFSLRFETADVESIANTLVAVVTNQSRANIALAGKVDAYQNGDTIYTNSNAPELLYDIGYPFVNTISDSLYYTTKVIRGQAVSSGVEPASTLQLDLTSIDPASVNDIEFAGPKGTAMSADVFKQNYIVFVSSTGDVAASGPVGTILDFTSSGNTATVSSDGKMLTLTSNHYKPLAANPLSLTVIAKVNVIDASASPILKTKTLITGSSSVASNTGPDGIVNGTYIDLTNGQVYIKNANLAGTGIAQSLYVPDIKKITKIIDTGSPTTPPTVDMLTNSAYDVTNNFTMDNGQRDSYYDHATITLNYGAPVPRGDILVVFDYYSHTGGDGYFSVASYTNETYAEIPTYVSKVGNIYRLGDSLDFRPSRKPATNTFSYKYTIEPTTTNAGGFYIPQDLTNWVSDYTYYLGRKDMLVLTKDKNFQIIKGTPAINPVLPAQPDGSLVIANITHDPYTAYLPSEAPKGILPNLSLEKIQHRRWTMKDISDLQTRVNNIEYYTSLSLLEQQTQSLQVSDANGLNRFKNGILVDDFSTNAVADTANPDFSASIDRVTKRMTATQTVENFPFQSEAAVSSINNLDQSAYSFAINHIGKGTNFFSLPYSNTSVIIQQLASNTINLNPFTTPVYQGVCYLNPPMDNWVDNTKEPDLLLVDPNLHVYQQSKKLNVLNVTNWQTIPGSRHATAPKRTYTRGHGINPSPFGKAGYSTTTYQTVETQEATQTKGYWTNLGSSYSELGNGFITDISIQPYIRAQDLIFRAKGLLINTPVSAYFDGENVNDHISAPDVLELTGVTGTFKDGDVIGYTDTVTNNFMPIATVISAFVYPNQTSKVRLYIASNFHTGHKNFALSNIIKNAKFSGSGVYQSSTAQGTLSVANGVFGFATSGTVNSVGGPHLDAASNTVHTFVATVPGYGEFLNTYGVWGDPIGGFPVFNHTYTVDFPRTGTYYFQAASDGSVLSTGCVVFLDGTLIMGPGIITGISAVYSQTVTAGAHTVHVISNEIAALMNTKQVAVAISTAPWKASGDQHLYGAKTDGEVIFNTRTPTVSLPIDSSITASTNMYGGGKYHTGVTKIGLHPSAVANSNTVYVGSTINITTTKVTAPTKAGKKPTTQVLKYKRTITAYDSTKRIATLNSAVTISIGYNKALGKSIASRYSIKGLAKSYSLAIQQGGHPDFSTNENGDFMGIFHVPPSTFRTGERIFRIDNRLTDGDPSSATTFAEATFTASGLATKSQSLNFSPSISAAKRTVTSTKTREKVITTAVVKNRWDPVAQSFIIDGENYPNGVFLRSAKFFFRTKPTTVATPVTLSIVGTTNGYPNGTSLDYSVVTLSPHEVNTSTSPQYLDSSTYTEFVFEAPVYIQPNTLYAFILHSESNDYNVYTAVQNATALPSSVKNLPSDATPTVITKIGTAPYIGALFESQNAITWVADPTKALMFVVDRCVFDTTVTPTIPFVVPAGLPNRKPTTQDIQNYYSDILGNDLHGTFVNDDIAVGAFNFTTTEFVPTGTSTDYTYQATLLSTRTYDSVTSVIPGNYASPNHENIFLDDGKGERVLIANSSNSLYFNATLSSDSDTVSPIISDDGLSVYTVQWDINNLSMSNDCIILVNGGTGYANGTPNANVTISAPDVSGGTQAYATANVTDGVIDSIYITNGGSGYLYPATITITGQGTGANAQTVSEFSASGGTSAQKYITKKMTLAAGNDSEDLRVYFTAYRPQGTNIYVFYRLQNRNDNQTFEEAPWQLMTFVNNTNGYSKSITDLLEFEAAPGINNIANNQISYTSTTGTQYSSFSQFSIKIILTTSDKTVIPFLSDMRALALPAGTGI